MRLFFFSGLFCYVIVAGLVQPDPAAPLQTPADAVAQALADVKANPDGCASFRYLWLGNLSSVEHGQQLGATVNFAVNSLSHRKHLLPLHAVSTSVLRLDLRNYGLSADAWDDLGAHGSGPVRSTAKIDCPEPYFHFQSTTTTQEVVEKLVNVPSFRHTDGKTYNQKWINEPTGKKTTKTQLLHGPWLPAETVKDLILATQTDFPIVRADWFLANALLPPAYQKLIDAKDIKSFDEQVRFRTRDEDLAVKGVVLFSSEVAIHNRALQRSPTSLGYYWKSFDFLTSVAAQDMLANVLANQADAHEIISTGPNNLQHYLIVNGQNEIIDYADPNVAVDRSTAWDNKLVWTGLSCMVCHAKGLKPFTDDVRKLADLNKRVFALVRPEHLERFTDLFAPQIADFVAADQVKYAAAVQQITGNLPEKNAAILSRTFLDYVQAPVTLDRVVLETGYSKDRIRAILANRTGLEHTLIQLLADSPVRRDQFERSYSQLMILMAGSKP